MKNFLIKIKLYIIAHKIISAIVIIAIIGTGYWGYNKITSTAGETQYITTVVQKGTIVSSVTASGQVESSNQIDLKADISGTITYVGVKAGDKVVRGKTLFSIDNKDALKSIRDAEISLESAQISYDKFKIQNSDANMNADLAKAYDDGFNMVSSVFLDIPGIMTGLNDMFFKSSSGTQQQWNIDWYEGQINTEDVDKVKIYKQNFIDSYNLALKAYNNNFDSYKLVSRKSDNTTIENMISETYETNELISDAIRNANNYLDFINSSIQKYNSNTPPAILSTHKASLNTYTSKTNGFLTSLLSSKTNIKSYKDAFTNNDLDTRSQDISLQQKIDALQDAKDKLSDYYVGAPFNGIIASVTAKVGDTASGTLGSIITNQQIATLSMNEIDVSKIKLGEKATVTFDAIEDLSMTGSVVEIDSIGTVSQGVVNYNVKISFDTNDARIKPGMTANAAIITNIVQDVLIVPNSAIKTGGGISYVQMFDTALPAPLTGVQGSPSLVPPRNQNVEIGISDGTSTEITSGLKEGDEIVTKTITSTTKTTTTPAPSILGAPGGGARSGGAIRIGG